MRGRRKSCAACPQEGRHAVSKINRAISMKITIEDSKRCNILAKRKRGWRQSVREEDLIGRKALDSTLFYRQREWIPPSPITCEEYFIYGRIRPMNRVNSWGTRKTDEGASEPLIS